jgi:hypothetical protein
LATSDVAYAMSPIGGVGIDLAVRDAIATVNLLVQPLRDGICRQSTSYGSTFAAPCPGPTTPAGVLHRHPILQAIPAA